MSKHFDCRDAQQRTEGIEAAVTAVRAGELIVLPTDTVYGIGADAFIPSSVTTMLAAKGRGRNMPPPREPRPRWWTTSARSGRT
jgi:tRNA A37 threonylcarbamoyladenosine synthetase subunit TsaC/SUA5/YrdC